VTDLSEEFALKLSGVLDRQRAQLGRFAGLLDAQRAAFRSDDMELVSEVSGEAAHLLQNLEQTARHLSTRNGPLGESHGPRSDAIRAALATLVTEVDRTLAEVRQFSAVLEERRARLVRAILEEETAGMPRSGNNCRGSGPGSSFLDRTG
jgi:hypothetical protein